MCALLESIKGTENSHSRTLNFVFLGVRPILFFLYKHLKYSFQYDLAIKIKTEFYKYLKIAFVIFLEHYKIESANT